MPDLLLELLTEEIPARMQVRAHDDLYQRFMSQTTNAGIPCHATEVFYGPRRLTLFAEGLPLEAPAVTEERRGPRVGAPEAAVQGFLKSAGLSSLSQCEERDTGKGVFHFAVIERPGGPAAGLLSAIIRNLITDFPWPKSMRFPAASFRWVRPLTSVLSIFDGEILPIDLGDVPVGDITRGHRFLNPKHFSVRTCTAYIEELEARYVIVDYKRRWEAIRVGLNEQANLLGLKVKNEVDDRALLVEVNGLVEWPVVLAGRIDPAFMELPPEVLTTSMRMHQKYFACLDGAGKLAPHFLLVSNMAAEDGGAAIVAGNERVLRARLSDARFFWDLDRKTKLADRVPKLAERVFHAKLGSVLDKVRRVTALAQALAPHIPGADAAQVARAAELAKADLSTGMVGEVPELQGIMGRYYALGDGEAPEVAEAIAEHYSPLGPGDRCPTAPVSVAIALADKIDTLVGFFSIGETPTGSKDPFALRRAALGVIRLIVENRLRLPLGRVFAEAAAGNRGKTVEDLGLLAFFADRLKVALRDKGVRHDLVAAVFALGGEDDLVRLLARVDALAGFLETEDGANLLVAYRRASNIVRIEEKKDGKSYAEAPDPRLLAQAEEKLLAEALDAARRRSAEALAREDFAGAMAALAGLRRPGDEFFTKVTVNCEDAALRANRLRLLSHIRETLNRVADFSLIEG